jgi:hypothetical protein
MAASEAGQPGPLRSFLVRTSNRAQCSGHSTTWPSSRPFVNGQVALEHGVATATCPASSSAARVREWPERSALNP